MSTFNHHHCKTMLIRFKHYFFAQKIGIIFKLIFLHKQEYNLIFFRIIIIVSMQLKMESVNSTLFGDQINAVFVFNI